MSTLRTGRTAAAALAASLLAAAALAPAAGAAVDTRVVYRVSPNRLQRPPANGFGTPIKLSTNMTITHPADSTLRLTKVHVLLPGGVAKPNGNLFPSCSAAALNKARGRLSVCPKGSRIGRGLAIGTAVDIGVTSNGRLTFFNGPRGKSLTLNVSIIHPALINVSFQAPIKKIRGRYGYSVTFNIPPDLQTILDGPIVVRAIRATVGATIVHKGRKRGYIEAYKCPKSGKVAAAAEFTFDDGSRSRSETQIACK